MTMLVLPIAAGLIVAAAFPRVASAAGEPSPPGRVTFHGPAKAPISSYVAIPAGKAMLWFSGTVPPVIDSAAAEGTRARYGDTEKQGDGILARFEELLKAEGLGLKDVVYMRVYVVPDSAKGGKPDFEGWFKAYGKRFGTEANPSKPARATVSVPALVNPGWLIEIEAFAAYP